MNTSRKLLVAGVAAAAASALASAAFAQNTDTATASASVDIIRPITVTKDTDLYFGRVVPDTSAGTVAIGTGSDTATPATVPLAAGGTPTRAKFTVNGEGGQAYSITLPSGSLSLGLSGTLYVDSWATDVASPQLDNALGSAGTQDFYVGATLHVPASAAAGNYTGNFDVTVTYN